MMQSKSSANQVMSITILAPCRPLLLLLVRRAE